MRHRCFKSNYFFQMAAVLVVSVLPVCIAKAEIIGPYTSDANTLMLYHFDEVSGTTDPGNPIVNFGTKGTSFNLTNTGGPDGRDNTAGGGYGATAYAGFGSSFDILGAGNDSWNLNSTSQGGGLNTGNGVAPSDLYGTTGAFTYEALVKLNNITDEQQIISRDNTASGNRGFVFSITGGKIGLYPNDNGGSNLTFDIPTTGDDAFDADDWYHVAVSYDGNEGDLDNLSMYWTLLDSSNTEASLLGTGTLTNDLTKGTGELYIGTTGRNPYRRELGGLIDEVRISDTARGPSDFIFAAPAPAVPEPSTFVLAALGLLGMVAFRRRQK